MDSLARDVRYAIRQMARVPMLTAVATLVLALGIGTNTAILAVLDGALFRAPPGTHETDALVNIRSVPVEATATGFFNDGLTYTEFLALREDAPS